MIRIQIILDNIVPEVGTGVIVHRSDLDDQLSRQFLNSKKFIGDNSVIEMDSRDQLKALLKKACHSR